MTFEDLIFGRGVDPDDPALARYLTRIRVVQRRALKIAKRECRRIRRLIERVARAQRRIA